MLGNIYCGLSLRLLNWMEKLHNDRFIRMISIYQSESIGAGHFLSITPHHMCVIMTSGEKHDKWTLSQNLHNFYFHLKKSSLPQNSKNLHTCYYTRYCIRCHMICYVTVVFFLKLHFLWISSQALPWMIETWMKSMSFIGTKVWYILHPNIFVTKYRHGWLEFGRRIT